MNYQIDVSSSLSTPPADANNAPTLTPPDAVECLRQMLEIQREQLVLQRNAAAAHDMTARWRSYLSRWQQEFPELSDGCRKAMPILERSYGCLITELTTKLGEDQFDLENEFSLQEFLDRYGMKLAQLGTILNLIGPLAEAGTPAESS